MNEGKGIELTYHTTIKPIKENLTREYRYQTNLELKKNEEVAEKANLILNKNQKS